MFEHVCQPGDSVINEGDDGDNFYVIESGNYDVYKVDSNSNAICWRFTALFS